MPRRIASPMAGSTANTRARLRRRPENRREIPGRSADPARSHRRRNRSSADHRTADAPGARRAAVRRRIRYPRPHPCVGSARVRALHALGLRCDVRRVCVRRRGSAATVSIGVRRFESAHRAGKPSVHRIARLAGVRIVGCGPHRRVARGDAGRRRRRRTRVAFGRMSAGIASSCPPRPARQTPSCC